MIVVKAHDNRVEVSIPTEGMTSKEVNEFVAWLRLEIIAHRSKLTPEAAWQLSEDIKSSWWQANEQHLTSQGE